MITDKVWRAEKAVDGSVILKLALRYSIVVGYSYSNIYIIIIL